MTRIRFKGLCGEATLSGKKVLLLKPLDLHEPQWAVRTGGDVLFTGSPAERVLVIFDDISLPRPDSDPAKGERRRAQWDENIIYLSGKDTFPRIKVGVGAKPSPEWELADWVLSRFSTDEAGLIGEAARHAAEACALIVDGEIERAMNLFNG